MGEYRFAEFRREFLFEDMGFQAGPSPGEPFPDFDLATVDGERLKKHELLGRPLLVVFSSFT